jgi:hypothetical protein
MKSILLLFIALTSGTCNSQSMAQRNASTTAAQSAWSRVLKARGFDAVPVRSIVVVESSKRARLEATFVHSEGRGWWILWDHRPTVLGAVLEVYNTRNKTAFSSRAENGEFSKLAPKEFGLRADYRLQFLAIYELNSPELDPVPVSVSPCTDNDDCLVLKVKDRTLTYRIDRTTYLPKEVTLDIPPQKATLGGAPATDAVAMVTKLNTYKNIGGLMQPEKIERNGTTFSVEIFLNPSIRSNLFEPSLSHVPANKMAWQAAR